MEDESSGDALPGDNDVRIMRRHSLSPNLIKSLENDLMRDMINIDIPGAIQNANLDGGGTSESSHATLTSTMATQSMMETLNISPPEQSPSSLTPASVTPQAASPVGQAKIGWCDGCCGSIPIKTSPARLGPISAYSVCFGFELVLLYFMLYCNELK